MSWLDAVLVALVAASLLSGYRRGAVLQVAGLGGSLLGIAAGVALAPVVARDADAPATAIALVFGTVLAAGAAGGIAGRAVGNRLRPRASGSRFRRIDRVAGSIVSAAALLAAAWVLSVNLAEGPFAGLSRGVRDSLIVRSFDAALPAPPPLFGEASDLLSLLGFPDVFVGMPPEPSAPVEPPSRAETAAATRAAAGSTVEVLGSGCELGFVNQGSGFVVGDGLVVTNAHVLAGTTSQWVHAAGERAEASVAVFDPGVDVAVLRVPGLELTPLPLLRGEAERGDVGAVLGYPGGGALTAGDAAVRAVIEPVGRDIDGGSQIRRRLYELQTTVDRGNSGGPFVLPSGRVAGLVFSSSVVDDAIGYAIVSDDVRPLVARAASSSGVVATGACAA